MMRVLLSKTQLDRPSRPEHETVASYEWVHDHMGPNSYVIHDLIGPSPTAVVVSDRDAGYAHLDPSQRHVCWAACGRQVS